MHVTDAFVRNLTAATEQTTPYRHWLLDEVFPAETVDRLAHMDMVVDAEKLVFSGRRESNNGMRVFFDAALQAREPAVRDVAEAFRDPRTVSAVEQRCGLDLRGSYVRLEYCLDVDGFWLEPHTDIGAKMVTMLFYLGAGEGSAPCGTDIMDEAGNVLAQAPSEPNTGLIFVPGSDTWHGFTKRRICGLRRTIMANYVIPEWRARHELAFPEPIPG